MINIRLFLVLIYFTNNLYAWNFFNRQNKIQKIKKVKKIQKVELKDDENNTNNTFFLDDEEFMQLLRFYRPI